MPTILPQNVINELKSWLSDITQPFGKNGETGIDIGQRGLGGKAIDNPVYAVTGGKVIGVGYYGGGGVVSIESNINYDGINGPASIYYQHLDQNLVKLGQIIQPGQLIGLSGGQLFGGSHPSSSKFSSGSHIEIGINAPYGKANKSIWSPLGINVNPKDFFAALASGNTGVLGIGNGSSSNSTSDGNSIPVISGIQDVVNSIMTGVGNTAGDVAGMPSQAFAGALSVGIQNATEQLANIAGANVKKSTGINGIADFLWRFGLLTLALILFITGFVAIISDLAPKPDVNPAEIAGLVAAAG